MAGPHVVGVVALLWSARPQLVRDIDATKTILQNTANPNVTVSPVQTCGGIPSTQIPNNSFGYGRVDAFEAVNAAPGACIRTALSENFDAVTAPALPTGWVATNAVGAAPLWVTSTTTPYSAPNIAFVDDPGTQSDKRLDTRNINITSTVAQLSFRHKFDFDTAGSSFFDGAVLEVSSPNIAGGAFTDITAASVGGSFLLADTTPRLAVVSKTRSVAEADGAETRTGTLSPWRTSDLTWPGRQSNCAFVWGQTPLRLAQDGPLTTF